MKIRLIPSSLLLSSFLCLNFCFASCDLADVVKYHVRTYKINSLYKTAKNQHDKEELAEYAASKLFFANGFRRLPSKISGNQGIDLVFYKRQGREYIFVAHESKYLSSESNLNLRKNRDICDQMTHAWLRDRIMEMINSKNPDIQDTGLLLNNAGIRSIVRTANVRQGQTNHVFLITEKK